MLRRARVARVRAEVATMSHRNCLCVGASLAAAAIASLTTTSALAQGAACGKPQPITLGENPFANQASFDVQLSQSTSGFGEAFLYSVGWFSFTPSITAQYTFGLCGVNDDSKLALGEACPLAVDSPWDVLGYNDDSCAYAGGTGLWASKLYPGNAGRPLNAELLAGHTYLIAVGGYSFSTLPIVGSLSVDLVPPPIDACAVLQVGTLGANTLSMDASAPTLTVECGGVLSEIARTNYLRFTAPYTGVFTANTCAQTTDTILAVLTTCGDGATVIACDDDTCGSASSVSFAANAGQTVSIGVGLYSLTKLPPSTLTVEIGEETPPQDPCATITQLAVGSTVMPLNAALPDLVIPGQQATVVYSVNYASFIAPQAGVYQLSNCSSAGFDSMLVRTTECGNGAAVVAIDDDGCGVVGGPSKLRFFSEGGAMTIFGIGAWSEIDALPASTALSLTFVASPSDPCATPNMVEGFVGSNTVAMSLTYRALDLAGFCNPGPAGNDAIACARFIRFTAPTSGVYTVSNCGDTDPSGIGSVDARLAVLADCGSAATVLACDDDGCTAGVAPYTARLTFQAFAAQTYYIAVGGFDEFVTGPLHVVIEAPVPPSNPADFDQDGVVGSADLAVLLGNWLGAGRGDVDGSGIVDGADLALLLNAWG